MGKGGGAVHGGSYDESHPDVNEVELTLFHSQQIDCGCSILVGVSNTTPLALRHDIAESDIRRHGLVVDHEVRSVISGLGVC